MRRVNNVLSITNNSVNGGNYCLCCGNRTEYYGFCSLGSNGTRKICDKEVCVLCLEGGCPNCNGQKLAQPAGEYHKGCGCDEKKK